MNVAPPCACFRTKAYYLDGDCHVDRADCAPVAACWCARTVTVLGPDDVLCSLETCRPGRGCYQCSAAN